MPQSEIAAPAPLPTVVSRLENKQPLRILAMGSSSTWGIGTSRNRFNYPAQLEGILENVLKSVPIEIVSRGVSGETVATSADRLLMEAALIKPDLVLWQLGTSDAVQRIALEDFEEIVRRTILALKGREIDVVLVGLQYAPQYARDDHYVAMREALKSIATEQNVLYVRRYQAMEYIARAKASLMAMESQDLPPVDLAHECMAEHIAQAVIANIFVKRRKPPT